MITKPAVLECTGCGKVFIGYDRDPRPRGWPRCLKCSAIESWNTLAGVVGGERGSASRRKRRPAGSAATKPRAGARRGPARKRR
jgi:hypothetical protein